MIKPLEIDIYLPEYNLAIEYNGSYWHSSKLKDKFYHLNKTKLCRDKEIDLIHIFEYEWTDFRKQCIIKDIILNKIGRSKTIYARKCIIKEVSIKDKNNFLEDNHLKGKDKSKIKLGLYYNDELVQIVTFGKPRFNKKYDWELIRSCTLSGYHVIGGFSKLIKFFSKNNSINVISYCDLAKFNGNGYLKTGFKHINNSDPNYVWIKCTDILSRYKTMKHKLNLILSNFNSDLTEDENMSINGWLKVYDCGNQVLTLLV